MCIFVCVSVCVCVCVYFSMYAQKKKSNFQGYNVCICVCFLTNILSSLLFCQELQIANPAFNASTVFIPPYAPKFNARSPWQRMKSFFTMRIHYINVSVGEALIWAVFILINGLIMNMINKTNGLGWETNFGYLAMGNSVLLVVPATRNSVLHLLVRTLVNIHIRSTLFFSQ